MMNDQAYKKNNLGLWGWLGGGRYGLERYAYAIHRLTGLGILLYFILHIIVTSSRIWGAEAWEQTMHSFENPFFKFGEFLVFAAFVYHALNGLRLLFTELGLLMGKPMRPVIPYKNAVRRQRPVMIIVMVLAALLVILGGMDFYTM